MVSLHLYCLDGIQYYDDYSKRYTNVPSREKDLDTYLFLQFVSGKKRPTMKKLT